MTTFCECCNHPRSYCSGRLCRRCYRAIGEFKRIIIREAIATFGPKGATVIEISQRINQWLREEKTVPSNRGPR